MVKRWQHIQTKLVRVFRYDVTSWPRILTHPGIVKLFKMNRVDFYRTFYVCMLLIIVNFLTLNLLFASLFFGT